MESKRKKIVKSNPADFEKFAAPTFNIHIHVPSCSSRVSSVYLPRIQPVIHLHFDKNLSVPQVKEKQLSDKIFKRTFKNLLNLASPRFGDVKFHFDNKLKESDVKENEINNVVPDSSDNNDRGLNKNEGLQKIQKDISGNIESVTSSSIIHDRNIENNEGHKTPVSYWLDKDLKLRTAVVVLKDISKDKIYKDLIPAAKTNNSLLNLSNKDDFSCDAVRTDQAQQMNKTVIKEEDEFYTSELSTEDKNESKFEFLDSCNNASMKELFNNDFNDKETVKRKSSLISLAEGCNFSEILTKFKIKFNQNKSNFLKTDDRSIKKETTFEVSNTEEGNKNIEDGKTSDEMNYKMSNFNDMCVDFNKSKFDVMENEHFNGNNSLKEVMGVSLLSCHDNIKYINLDCSKSDLPELNIKQEFNISTTDNTVTDFNSDECNTIETTSEKELSSEQNVTDLDIVEPNSFSLSHLLLNKLDASGMDKDMPVSPKNFSDTKKSVSIKEEYETESTESSSSLSKKMKYSDEKAEKSGNKVMKPSSAEDYIILNEAGPTKFAIAPLDTTKLYKRHPAENFKNEMLYGNGVQRFSSSHLQTYKAKNASRKSFNESY